MCNSQTHRRHFLSAAAGLLAWPALIPSSSRAAAVERSSVAVVGLGTRGTHLLKQFLAHPDVQVTAVCDVHRLHYRDQAWGQGPALGLEPAQALVEKHYAAESKAGRYRGCTAYTDYRRLLARSDLDAVVVATPDHWHARVCLDAIESGRDVYCEKPVTHFFREGLRLIEAVKQHGTVFQVGSQQRSDRLFRRAVEVVRNGLLGKLTRVEVGLPAGYDAALDDVTIQTPPAGLDYDLWCGPAPQLPYMRARHHRWWRATRAFGGGVLMDWIGHHHDIAHWSLDQDTGGPSRVEASGWTASGCELYDTPVHYEIRCQYPGDVDVIISTQAEAGTRWIGETGWLWVNRGQLLSSEPRWLEPDFKAGDWQAYRADDHVANFVDSLRKRTPCSTSAETGHRSITPGHLGYVSHAVGRALTWDPKRQHIVGDPEAQTLLMTAPYRHPWSLE